jgi:hypothetical protein
MNKFIKLIAACTIPLVYFVIVFFEVNILIELLNKHIAFFTQFLLLSRNLIVFSPLQIDDIDFRVSLQLNGELSIYFGHIDYVVGFL